MRYYHKELERQALALMLTPNPSRGVMLAATNTLLTLKDSCTKIPPDIKFEGEGKALFSYEKNP